MTREELVEGLKLLEDNMVHFDELQNDRGEWIDVHELLFEAIQALLQEPTSEDAISRQAVLDRIRESIETYHNQYTTDMLNMWGLFTQFIKEMPSVTPQQKYGKWIAHEKPNGIRYLECPHCNTWYLNEHLIRNSYCPNCGAKMQESEE